MNILSFLFVNPCGAGCRVKVLRAPDDAVKVRPHFEIQALAPILLTFPGRSLWALWKVL